MRLEIMRLGDYFFHLNKKYTMTNDKLIKLDDFDIYKIAMEIGEDVWNIVKDWESFAKNTIGNQIVRSADSIAANIAEGYGRF
jgi:transglutaminase/protease-like cytokinesis protein 3